MLKLANDLVDLFVMEDFLARGECERLVDLIRTRLTPSPLVRVDKEGDPGYDPAFRTSRTCYIGQLDDPLVGEVDERICATVGLDPAYAEVTQGQYYEVGQEFKAHTDFFEASQREYVLGNGPGSYSGQRTMTFMVYLNNVPDGGKTHFLNLRTAITPRRGLALMWNNLTPDGTPNLNTIHHANPVLRGYKCIITKWFRQNALS